MTVICREGSAVGPDADTRTLVASALALVSWSRTTSLQDLLVSTGTDNAFSIQERVFSTAGQGLTSWAGRIAAKRAVRRNLQELIGDEAFVVCSLGDIEVLPQSIYDCTSPRLCDLGHPPHVSTEVLGRLGLEADISISHEAFEAVAFCQLRSAATATRIVSLKA